MSEKDTESDTTPNPEKYKEIALQLGDVIQIIDTENEELNNQTFMIDYIDNSKIVLLNTVSFDKYVLKIQENGTLGNGTIREIHILWRSEYPGYARQNNLLPGIWINLYFNSDVPTIITGQITNLEEDMIEIKTYPDKDVIYINFEYKGIPEDIPIETIEIREPPETAKLSLEEKSIEEKGIEAKGTEEIVNAPITPEELAQMDKDERETMIEMAEDSKFVPAEKINDQLREFIIQADEIEFGIGEDLGEISQYVDVGKRRQRFDVQAQANDLLDEMLSTIPNSERTTRVLQNIHIMIERFKQLRMQFSTFDEYGNVDGAFMKTANWKPLLQELLKFNNILYWILPVVKNVKKIYDQGVSPYQDIINLNIDENLSDMDQIVQNYKSNNSSDEQNKYISLVTDMNKYFTPFASLDPENMSDIIYEKEVGENLNVIVDNLGDFYSTVVDNDRIKSRRFVIQKYNLGLNRLVTMHFNGPTQRVKLTQPDEMSIKSLLTMREPVVRFSRINLPGTSILDRANLNLSFLQYWQLLNANTNVNNVMIDEFDLEKEKKRERKLTKKPIETRIAEYIEEEYYDENETMEEGEIKEVKTRMVKNPEFVEKAEAEAKVKSAEEEEEDKFLKHATNYLLISPESDEMTFKKDELYQQFLEKVIPKTSVLFKLVKKYIVNKVSIVDAVSYLEPFMVYGDDLTYMQYKDMIQFLDTTVSSYNKNFVEKSRAFGSLKNIWNIKKHSSFVNAIYNNIRDNAEQIMDIDYRCGADKSNGEILTKMTEKDDGRLYNSTLANQSLSLMFHDSMRAILNKENEEYSSRTDEEKAKDKCTTYVLTKQYTSEEELMADNGKEKPIYFDKKFDKTNYSILEDYAKEMTTMEPEMFINFLIEKLQKKMKLTQGEAEYLVDTLISGIKEVVDGQYAFIYNIAENVDNIKYYKRINGQWIPDDSVDKSFFVTDDNILCNIKKDCIDVKDECISTELNKTTLIKQTLDNALNEFDQKYNQTKEELEKQIGEEFQYNKTIIERLGKIQFERKFQYNNQQFLIGVKTSAYESEKEALVKISPFQKLRDLILGETDFIKKQNDIIRFALTFTREPLKNSIDETVHWRYCIKTNVPLLPAFLYSMASIFVNNPTNYLGEVDRIIKEIGKLSDDGDAWVDQYSGYVIRKIDFDVEEGYEESGFKIKSRDVLEQESGDLFKTAPSFQTYEIKICSNIITALSTYMGIQLDEQREFIIQNVTTAFKQAIPSEKDYKQQIDSASKRGKSIPSYKEVYNSTLLYMTLGMFLIGIQTSIPSIKTRKTFPGCVRSFKGYPFQGTGDDSSVIYLACVAYNIRTAVEPWNVLMKKKEVFIADKIKLSIDNYFLNNPNVVRKFQEKAEYLMTSPMDTTIPEEHDIKNWFQFLPPLTPVKIGSLANITPEFKTKLLSELKHGGIYQRDKLLVVASKMIFFSLGIQERIQKIIKKKQPLLTNVNNEAFIENACCNERALGNEYSVIDYFIKEDAEIASYNEIVHQLSNMLRDVDSITNAPWLFSRENTKNIYPSVKQEFNEDTIYRAFIVYCNFTNLLPISDALFSVCSEKPGYISKNDSTTEIIKKLKNDGRIYNNASLLRLLQTVGREHIVRVKIELPYSSPVEIMKNVIKKIDEIEEPIAASFRGADADEDSAVMSPDKETDLIYPALRKMLLNNINSFELSLEVDTPELRSMKNHLARTNQEMKQQIIQFIKENNTVAERKSRNISKLLDDLTMWNGIRFGEELNADTDIKRSEYEKQQDSKISDDMGYNCINFIKSYIQNFVKTFPNIILNTVDYSNIKVHGYWGLSMSHASDIKTLVGKYYAELRPFYSDKFLSSMLREIQTRGENLIKLANETPYFTASQDRKKRATFDKRTSSLLFEHYILLIFMEYINLTDDDSMLFVEEVQRDIFGDIFTVESIEENEQHVEVTNDMIDNEVILEGNKKQLKTSTANMLIAYFLIMREHKNIVDDSYDSIMDKVFKLREKEKDDTTDRKKKMTDDERNVDTVMQINKLGLWGKGLQKGLTIYQKETYDEERNQADEFANLERQLKKKNKNVNDRNIDQYMDDLMEEVESDRIIEQEEYDMAGMTEDYWNGNPYGDEPDED